MSGIGGALRCSTRGASDTILGAGMATAGHTASDVAGDQRGVGLLIAEGEQPVRLRSFYLSEDDLDILAARARRLRGPDDEPAAPTAAAPSPTSPPRDVRGRRDALDRNRRNRLDRRPGLGRRHRLEATRRRPVGRAELRRLMGDLWVLLNATAGRLEAVLQERCWLREQARP
ncbi:MAG: hypothetical protein ACRDYA_12130 [Egibacteraceae bacterium]